MWRNFSTWHIVTWRDSPHDRLTCGKSSPYQKCEENLFCGEISPHDRLSCVEISPCEQCGAKSCMWWNFFTFLSVRFKTLSGVDSIWMFSFLFVHLVLYQKYGEISPHIYQINNVYNLWCFNAYCAVLLQNRLILRFTLFCRKICFVAIYALLRGEKLSKKLCPWRKKDKYDVWYRYWYLSKVSIYRQSIFHIGKAIVGRIYPIPLYTPNDIHPPIFGKKCTILMYTQTDVHHSTLGPKVPQTPINF